MCLCANGNSNRDGRKNNANAAQVVVSSVVECVFLGIHCLAVFFLLTRGQAQEFHCFPFEPAQMKIKSILFHSTLFYSILFYSRQDSTKHAVVPLACSLPWPQKQTVLKSSRSRATKRLTLPFGHPTRPALLAHFPLPAFRLGQRLALTHSPSLSLPPLPLPRRVAPQSGAAGYKSLSGSTR